ALRTQEVQQLPTVRGILGNDLQGGQCGSRQDDPGNAPKKAAEPEGEKYQHGIQAQPAADQKRLNDLTLDRHESQETSGDGSDLRGSVEGDEGDGGQQDESRSRPGVGNEIEDGGERTPEKRVG